MATEILAENLNRLIGPGKHFPSNEAADMRSKVGRSTFDRARRNETAVRLDKLSAIAAAFGLEAWQLLVPGADPNAPPTIAGSEGSTPLRSADETLLVRLFAQLSPDFRALLLADAQKYLDAQVRTADKRAVG